jgi:regulator of protease activity HflC (stomatin/prohibitin superfamily)
VACAARARRPDPDDRESGGQPVTLSVSFQYQLRREKVPIVYQTYGMAWEASYMRFAQQAITNVAQQFTPKQFWNTRRDIETTMLHAVNRTLFEQGHASCVNLQLLKVDFKSNYEQTITNIQLQEQLKVTKNYALDVTRVLKEVDILGSQTQAEIALIEARASREANVIVNQAEADALILEQNTKALWYGKLKKKLGWTNADFLQYVKIKSLSAQPADSMVVGVSAMGS